MIVGIDPGMKSLNAVVLDSTGTHADLIRHVPNRKQPDYKVFGAMYEWAEDLPGTTVYLESPIMWRSSRSTLQLALASGALQAGLARSGKQVVMVNVSHWKKVVVGSGRADKDQVAATIKGFLPEFYADFGTNQDAMDAAAIALYGYRVRRTRLKKGKTLATEEA